MRLIPGHVYATGGFNLYYVGTQYAKSRNTPGARIMAAPTDEAEIGNATRWTVSSDSGKMRCFKIGAGAIDAAEDVSVAGAAFENKKMTQKELIAIKKQLTTAYGVTWDGAGEMATAADVVDNICDITPLRDLPEDFLQDSGPAGSPMLSDFGGSGLRMGPITEEVSGLHGDDEVMELMSSMSIRLGKLERKNAGLEMRLEQYHDGYTHVTARFQDLFAPSRDRLVEGG